MTSEESPADVVAGLDLDTKIRLLSGATFWTTEAVDGIPAIRVADGPHGIRRQVEADDHLGMSDARPATCFPPAITLASTWDVELAEEIGVALGIEARHHEVDVVLGPAMNLVRHPAGGRTFEYLSEDPFLTGKMAAATVRGIQSQGVGACAKHYVANNQEFYRMRVDAIIDQRTLRELYLATFEIVIRESAPWTVMSAYNLVNGEHVGESAQLLTSILREEWGFDGVVMSDWFATADRTTSVAAGMDLEMPGSAGVWDGEVRAAIHSGRLPSEAVDRACRNLATLAARAVEGRMASGVRSAPRAAGDSTDVMDQHDDLARRAAAAGTVLLTNDGILPLAAETLASEHSIGVIGQFARESRYQGGGSSRVNPTRVDDLLGALGQRLGRDVPFAPGYDGETGESSAADVGEAVRLAAACDVVVLVVGLPALIESEGWDRDTLRLPPAMDDLVRTICAVASQVVVVLQNGAPVEIPWAEEPAAVIEAWLGGQAGGSALAQVLLGEVEPRGRLAHSIPVAVADLAADADFADHPTRVVHRETLFVGYRFHDTFDVEPRFPFGHGLGYTTVELGSPAVEGVGTDLTVSVEVTNTGSRSGTAVVQVYVHDVESTVHRPEQELKGFVAVALDPGTSRRVTVRLDRRAFAVYDVAAADWLVEAGRFEIRIGTSSRDIAGVVTVDIESDDVVTAVPGPLGAVATDEELGVLLGHAVPPPRPIVPFTRDTTMADLQQTRRGRVLARTLTALQRQVLPDETDPLTRKMMRIGAEQGPLRVLPMVARQPLAMAVVDQLIAALNVGRASADTEEAGGLRGVAEPHPD
ncbi:glycoside hydrolase family 3 C-terminal domain-containing protein [Euzebya tangerina]|uniref:glycoside hydrolase family 3 C-terminal domain-containing protein n=1 Tax=Euzebya tangerina TaxID=591198 RepID=UPI00196B607C|nr:glycoside hydrolase family 3 C-terminal domain-containing protein [Euzebya tangerina]